MGKAGNGSKLEKQTLSNKTETKTETETEIRRNRQTGKDHAHKKSEQVNRKVWHVTLGNDTSHAGSTLLKSHRNRKQIKNSQYSDEDSLWWSGPAYPVTTQLHA